MSLAEDRVALLESALAVLRCPACCQHARTWDGGTLRFEETQALLCEDCGARYEVRDGVPILIAPEATHPSSWSVQQAFFDSGTDPEFEIERPSAGGRFYNYLLTYKMQLAVDGLGQSLVGKRILDCCCGSGMFSEFLARRSESVVFGFDASHGAVARAVARSVRHGYEFVGVVADALLPPFRTQAFDVVAVHDALHHLDDPVAAVRQLALLSQCAFVAIEPADAFITRIATWIGFSDVVEEAGNYVRRLRRTDLERGVRSGGLHAVRWRRYIMYYPHQPGALFRAFDAAPLFWVARAAFHVLNRGLGTLGNKCEFLAIRPGAAQGGRGAGL